MENLNFDDVLIEIGGWGKFQKKTLVYLCLISMFSASHLSYIFVARDVNYRCFIPECDINENVNYKADWLKDALPFDDDTLNRCFRHKTETNDTCARFDKNVLLACNKFIYEIKQTTIASDFRINCDDNVWKLTIVGTINAVGELICLSFAGLTSDRYGRKFTITSSIILCTFVGFLKSFAFNYLIYICLEFLETTLSSAMYSGTFILAMETVNSKSRGTVNTCLSCAFAFGQVVLGVIAWATPSWQIMLRIIYAQGLVISVVSRTMPESARWLMLHGEYRQARNTIELIAKTNKKIINSNVINCWLNNQYQESSSKASTRNRKSARSVIFKSKVLFWRAILCSFVWICCVFHYYGLTIQSVALSKDVYINFMASAIVEVPAYFLTGYMIDKFGRRYSLATSLVGSGLFSTAAIFASPTRWMALSIFLSGKFLITIAYTTLYIYTAEMFPTSSRHTTFAICSMLGRLGSMLAPQLPLLARIFKTLPLIISATMAVTSGILSLLFPETHNIKLPDKIDEAEQIQDKNGVRDNDVDP